MRIDRNLGICSAIPFGPPGIRHVIGAGAWALIYWTMVSVDT